nr:MAG TPA: hypothetical protein [Caudoviricetes sp.]
MKRRSKRYECTCRYPVGYFRLGYSHRNRCVHRQSPCEIYRGGASCGQL